MEYGKTQNKNNDILIDATSIIYNKNNTLDKLFEYSTNEIAIGKWVDGKIIYRKVYTFTSVSNLTITSFSKLIKADCLFQVGGQWRNVPWLYASGTTFGAGAWGGGFYLSGTTCYFQVGDNLANISYGHLILEYVK